MSRHPDLPTVSCIIPVYNGEAYLHEAIDSLIAQEYPQVEIVVVNDGSTDGTADVIGRYGDRIRSLHQPNGGVSAARNRGVAMSSGRLLCFLDADDLLDERKIARQVDVLQGDETLDFCDCHSSYFWSPELSAEALASDARHAEPFWHKVLPGHVSTWLLRRELWDRVGGMVPGMHFSEDVDWLSRARDLSMRQRTLPNVLTRRRLHPGNVTARRAAEQGAALADMLKAHLTRVRNRSVR
jgi:glycosyltransferase involved in cell wall biosynthesis